MCCCCMNHSESSHHHTCPKICRCQSPKTYYHDSEETRKHVSTNTGRSQWTKFTMGGRLQIYLYQHAASTAPEQLFGSLAPAMPPFLVCYLFFIIFNLTWINESLLLWVKIKAAILHTYSLFRHNICIFHAGTSKLISSFFFISFP